MTDVRRPLPGRAPGPSGWTRADVVGLVASSVVIVALSYGAVRLRLPGSDTSLWWPAAGASVAAVLVARAPRRPVVVALVAVISALGNLVGGQSLLVSALYGLANAGEAAVAAWWLLRGRADRPALAGLDDLWRLVVGATLGALTLAVSASAVVVVVLGGPFWPTLPHLTASHLSATVLLVPLVLAPSAARGDAGSLETALQWATSVVLCILAFGLGQSLPLDFVPLAPLVWGALRLPPRTVTRQTVLLLLAVSALTVVGGGPFAAALRAGTAPLLAAGLVQTYVVVTVVVALSLSLAVAQRRDVLARVSRSERMYRSGFAGALLGSVIVRHRGERFVVVELNDVAAGLLGGEVDDLVGTEWLDHVARDRSGVRDRMREVVQGSRQGWRGEVVLAGERTGTPRWVEVSVSSIEGDAGLLMLHLVDMTSRRAAEEELTWVALHDGLTGLPNRVLLRERIERALAAGRRNGSSLAVLFLDLDHFKRINDTDGHEAGDEILVEVARRLSSAVREGDTVARLGGDEFVLLLPDVPADDVVSAVARVQASFTDPVTTAAGTYRLTSSIGVAVGSPDSTVSSLLRDADTAMYVSKASGRAQVTQFDADHRARALRDARITQEFDGAIGRGELRLHVQPVVEMLTGRVVAAEALVRWEHPVRGLLAPAEWLDVVERTAEGAALDRWVLGDAGRLAAAWTARYGADAPRLHVNVSTRLLAQGRLAGEVLTAFGAAGAPAHALVVELTESDLEGAPGSLLQELEALRASGVGLSVDDFGTGYSALNRLAELPVDELKIDRSFVSRMLREERSAAVVAAITSLARTLGLRVVAEGVEDEEQARRLRLAGCDLGQGYLWSKPVPPARLEAMLDDTTGRRRLRGAVQGAGRA